MILKIRVKLADLEDRSRCNNIKLRGIPKSIQLANIHKYASYLARCLTTGHYHYSNPLDFKTIPPGRLCPQGHINEGTLLPH